MSFFYPFTEGWIDDDGGVPEAVKDKVTGLSWDEVTVKKRALAFYPGCDFLMLKSDRWQPRNLFIYVMRAGEQLIVLNGTSPPIHEFNAAGHLKLSDENAFDYLQFFCFFVRGEEGPFYIVNDLAAPYLPMGIREGTKAENADNADLIDAAGAQLRTRYQSPRMFDGAEEGKFCISATVFYSNAVFVGDFSIAPGGMCEMRDDQPIVADIPIKIDAPITPPKREEILH